MIKLQFMEKPKSRFWNNNKTTIFYNNVVKNKCLKNI